MQKHNITLFVHIWIPRFLRIGFGLLLIYAAIDKIRYPLDFAQMVENYRVVGEDLSYWIAVFIPSLEIILGLLLMSGFWRRTAALMTMALMLVFLVLVTQAYVRGLDVHCGCFSTGEEGEAIGPMKIFSNIVYALLSIVLVFYLFAQSEEKQHGDHESAGKKGV